MYALPANGTAMFVAGGVAAGGVLVFPFLQDSISMQNRAALIDRKILRGIILIGYFLHSF
jgi:hypothetical protein